MGQAKSMYELSNKVQSVQSYFAVWVTNGGLMLRYIGYVASVSSTNTSQHLWERLHTSDDMGNLAQLR